MSKTLSGKRVISEASPFDQWWEIQFIGSVAPAAVVVGLDPVEYDLANLIPLHGGALEPVDQFLLQRCEKLSMRALSKQQCVRPMLCRMEPNPASIVRYSWLVYWLPWSECSISPF